MNNIPYPTYDGPRTTKEDDMGIPYNAGDVPEEKYAPKEPGVYTYTVEKAEEKTTKKGDATTNLTLSISDENGEFKGTCFENLYYHTSGSLKRVRSFWESAGQPMPDTDEQYDEGQCYVGQTGLVNLDVDEKGYFDVKWWVQAGYTAPEKESRFESSADEAPF